MARTLKFRSPKRINPDFHWTAVPNHFIEEWLPGHLNQSEIRVYLIIARLTYGYGKREATIHIDKLADMTHLNRRTVLRATASLKSKRLIRSMGSQRHPKMYEILPTRCGDMDATTTDTKLPAVVSLVSPQ